MALHFTDTEFADRKARLLAGMKAAEIDALVRFRQESMYWLTAMTRLAMSISVACADR